MRMMIGRWMIGRCSGCSRRTSVELTNHGLLCGPCIWEHINNKDMDLRVRCRACGECKGIGEFLIPSPIDPVSHIIATTCKSCRTKRGGD